MRVQFLYSAHFSFSKSAKIFKKIVLVPIFGHTYQLIVAGSIFGRVFGQYLKIPEISKSTKFEYGLLGTQFAKPCYKRILDFFKFFFTTRQKIRTFEILDFLCKTLIYKSFGQNKNVLHFQNCSFLIKKFSTENCFLDHWLNHLKSTGRFFRVLSNTV